MEINLGSGKEHRVIDLANMVNELTGQTLRMFNHLTFKKGLIQTLFFKKESVTEEMKKPFLGKKRFIK